MQRGFFFKCLPEFLLITAMLAVAVFLAPAYASSSKPFYVTIDGKRSLIESYKKRAELKMARSTDFCRGFKMPKLIGLWQCQPSTKGKSKCRAKYNCSHINKSFSRLSETRRLTKELNYVGRSRSSFTMVVAKKPFRNPNKYRYMDEIKEKRQEYRTAERRALKRLIKKRTQKLKEEMTEYDEFAQLEKELAIETRASSPAQRKNSIDELSSNSLAEDRRLLDDNIEEVAPFRMERVKSNTGNEEIIRIKKKDDEIPRDRKFQILSFSGAMTRVQDNNASSVATADVAWTPRWMFSPKWAFRGRLGGHFISAEIEDGAEEAETFLVYDLAGEFEYYLWEESGFFVSSGLGIQSWTSTTGGAFSTFSLGAGYLFDFNKVKVVDRLFVTYTSVGNEASNTELKVGIGVSF